MANYQTECKDGHCVCRFEMTPVTKKDGKIECVGQYKSEFRFSSASTIKAEEQILNRFMAVFTNLDILHRYQLETKQFQIKTNKMLVVQKSGGRARSESEQAIKATVKMMMMIDDKHTKNEDTGPEKYVDPAMIGVLVGMALMFIILCVVLRLFSKNLSVPTSKDVLDEDMNKQKNILITVVTNQLFHQGSRRGSRASSNASNKSPQKSPTKENNTAVPNHTESVTVEVQEPKV
ncbi:hypothetical protein C0J52_08619 [Blattella germanica]|nr:hypothetical protein C0J52_08619 [Blattella germanica]